MEANLRDRVEISNSLTPRTLLRPRRERPCRRRAAEQHDELAALDACHKGLSPPHAAGLAHPQPSTEGPAGPLANPELF